ncbi:MAG: hypothetical protein GY702_09570 [Desulfobulbaceae bacterium]|nr:hypothetical protein [Desulfobulbaceae bacterium]
MNQGAETITPSASVQTIPEGYHNGSGTVAGDSNLASSNIKSGMTIFGVAGNSNVVDTSSGNASVDNLTTGSVAWVDGTEIIGEYIPPTSCVSASMKTTLLANCQSYCGSMYTGTYIELYACEDGCDRGIESVPECL